jgi:ribosomal-protein-alanine N-acetyltransferase
VKHRVHVTRRLRIEPFEERHLTERYIGWLADAEVTRWSEQRHTHHSLESCRAYFESFRGTPNMFFAIVAKDDALGHIGNLNVYVDEKNGLADIGILIGERSAWGHGYGREAWGAVLNELLAEPGIRKVSGGCVAENAAMVRVMRACGMSEDGRRVRHYLYEGREADVVYFAAFAARPETSSTSS